MYFEHFGLVRPPFLSPPSLDALFMGAGHREGLAALEWGLVEPSGFTLLTGEVGTGKTTLIAALIAKGCGVGRIVRIWNPHLSFDEILRDGLRQLGVEAGGSGRLVLLDQLMRAVEEQTVVMIFDEAQELGEPVLEDLRLLSNMQSHQEHALQIILVGQPELLTRLARHSLRQLNQRIGARATLGALSASEVLDYTDCRIRAAGGSSSRVFSRTGLRALIQNSRGIPRRINILCHNAMMIACLEGAIQIDARHVNEAAREYDESKLHPAKSTWPRWPALRTKRMVWGGAAAVLVGAVWIGFPQVSRSRSREAATPRISRPDPIARHQGSSESLKTSLVSAQARPGSVADDRQQAALDATRAPASLAAVAPASATALAVTAAPARETASTTSPERPPDLAWQSGVVVRPGDSLSAIAKERLGSTRYLQRLVDANPEIQNPNLIYAGQRIRLGGN